MVHVNPDLWMITVPIQVFFFDCDSTLSLIEGVDILASMNGVEEQVHQITERCMSTTGLTVTDYRKRLDFIKPTQMQLQQLAKSYCTHVAPGAKEVIKLLHDIGKTVFIISSGIKSAILPFAEELGINPDRVLAVDVYFNEDGSYSSFDERSDLVQPKGKAIHIAKNIHSKERSILLGDGYTDWEAHSTVSRFIGYAGLHPKTWVREHSDFYIANTSIFPLLALGLTNEERINLGGEYKDWYERGLAAIEEGQVRIKEYDYVHHTNS